MEGFGSHELTLLSVLGLAILIPQIVSVMVYHRALSALPPERRKMPPNQTLLLLVPFFGTFWEFLVILRLSGSFEQYFEAIGHRGAGRCGRTVGLAFCVFNVCALIPVAGLVCSVIGFVLWLIYIFEVIDLRKQALKLEQKADS